MRRALIVLFVLTSFIYTQQVIIFISDNNENSFDIYMVSTEDVYGFQFSINTEELTGVEDLIFEGASGGSANEAGFIVNTNSSGVVLGFSLTGSYIPAGGEILTTIAWNADLDEISGFLSIDVTNIAGASGIALSWEVGQHYQIGNEGCTDNNACNYYSGALNDDGSCWYSNIGCECEEGIGAYLDDCGVCDDNTLNDNECVGCTDPNADNYEPGYTIEDGSCAYSINGDVVINELQISPINLDFGEEFSEYIELVNNSEHVIDLSGWTLSSVSGSFFIDETITFEPDSIIILSISDNSNLNLGLPVDYAWGFGTNFQLDNNADDIQLFDPTDDLIDEVNYNLDNWPISSGNSIELNNPEMNNNSLYNWSSGIQAYDLENNMGTPGTQNSNFTYVPEILIDPSELNFGVVYLGDSASASINIFNPGGSDLIITNISGNAIETEEIFYYSYTSPPFTIPPGDSAEVNVTFHAMEEWQFYQDVVSIISNSPTNPSIDVPIIGEVGSPMILAPSEQNVGEVYIPGYLEHSIEIINIGNYTAIIDTGYLEIGTAYSIVSDLQIQIEPEEMGIIIIGFEPTEAFNTTDVLHLFTNDITFPEIEIILNGYGYSPSIEIDPDTLYFPTIHVGEETELNISVTNTGNGNLTISEIQNESPFFSFPVQEWTISEGNTIEIPITFSPDHIGEYAAILTLLNNDLNYSQIPIQTFGNAVSSTIISVPFDSPTIQGGINMAGVGDTVLVDPGIYNEYINYNGHNIVLGSHFIMTGDTAYITQTVINGTPEYHGVTIADIPDSTTSLIGFTIQNSNKGINITNSNPNIINCIIKSNSNYGIKIYNSTISLIDNCTVSNNLCSGINVNSSGLNLLNSTISTNYSSTYGGGIYIQGYGENLFIENCSITGNIANSSGGGIYTEYNPQNNVTIENSSINGNSSGSSGGGIYTSRHTNISNTLIYENIAQLNGGGVYSYHYELALEGCNISSNNSQRGGGVYGRDVSDIIFQNVTIDQNHATNKGGGIYFYGTNDSYEQFSSSPVIFNSTIVNNSSEILGSGLYCTGHIDPIVQNSIFWGNLAADGVQMHLQDGSEIFITYSDIAGGQSGIVGFDDIIYQNNIDAYPDFVSIDDEDYHLLITSPCIDAGNPYAPFDPDGTIPDMGAYYFEQDGIPNIETSNQNIDFGGVPVEDLGQQFISIQNEGLSDLNVTGISISDDEFSTSDSIFTVPSFSSYEVTMNFVPSYEGIFNSSITFLSNDPDESEFTVELHGAGDALSIIDILDVPNDQGGMVGVHWHRNVFDGIDSSDHIMNYRVWREYDASRFEDDLDGSINEQNLQIWTREYVNHDDQLRSIAWELVGDIPAQQFEEYAFSAPTIMDSTSYGIPWTTFLVSAHTEDPLVFYEAIPDSGYSVDNLAPAAPFNLSGSMEDDNFIYLEWSVDEIPDFNYFSIYRDDELLSATSDTTFIDMLPPQEDQVNYYVTSSDFNENESTPSAIISLTVNLTIDQDIVLESLRWNNISFNIELPDYEVSTVFGDPNVFLVKDDSGNFYIPSIDINTIQNIETEKGYYIFLTGSNSIDLSLSGYDIDQGQYPIELLPIRFNNISYLPSIPLSIANVFEGLPILLIKDADGGFYIPEIDINTIDLAGGMKPGHGYEVFLSGMENATLIYPDENQLIRFDPPEIDQNILSESASLHYEITKTGISEPIIINSLTGQVQLGDELAVYANGLVVGATRIRDLTTPVVISTWAEVNEYGIELPGFEAGAVIELRLWSVEDNRELKVISQLDNYHFGQVPMTTGSIIVSRQDAIPQKFMLSSAYPNPFNPVTTFNYGIPYDAYVVIKAFDVRGKEVVELVNGQIKEGYHEIVWDASKLSSGMYFVRMTSGDFKAVQKIMFVK